MSDICPECRKPNSKVFDSRPNVEGTVTRRRRRCECGHRWTTYEMEAAAFKCLAEVRDTGKQIGALLSQQTNLLTAIEAMPTLPNDINFRPR